jgi:hypothetical protein
MSLLLARGLFLLGALVPQGEPEQGADPSAAAAIGRDQQAAPPAQKPQLESLFEGALVGAADAQDFAETPGYRHLLETLSNYGEEELRQKAARHLDVAQALADPAAWRGEIVRVHALLAGQMAVRLSRPLGEHVDAFRAFLTEADGSEGVVVDFLEEPPALELQDDVVEVEGVFFRTVRYENKKGAFVDAPYLIARGVRRLDTENLPRSTAFDGPWPKITLGAAVLVFVVRIFLTMRKKPSAPAASHAARALRERARVPLHPDPPAHKS